MKKWKTNLNIIWVIAAKDIVDAIRNKTMLAILLSVMLTIITGQALPLLLKLKAIPTAAIYDAGDAPLIDVLRRRDDLRVYTARSQAEMVSLITGRTEAVLGLIIPADFDMTLAAGQPVFLGGYAAHWATAKELAELKGLFEKEINTITGETVFINVTSPRLYPAPDVGGQPGMMAMSLVIATILICAVLVPYLMIDEKETHTLDALLVSPTSIGQVVAGKAIAGAAYGLLAGGTALLIGNTLIVHGWVAMLTVVCGTVFAVSIGLVMGSIFDNAQTMSIWTGGLMMALLAPIFAEMMVTSADWPAIVRTLLPQMPTALMTRLFLLSFAETVPPGAALGRLALILIWSLPLYAITAWRVRRMDRG